LPSTLLGLDEELRPFEKYQLNYRIALLASKEEARRAKIDEMKRKMKKR